MKYIEILIFLFNFALFLITPVFQQLLFSNICTKTYNVPVEECYTNSTMNGYVSKESSRWSMWLSLVQMIPYILSTWCVNFMASKFSPDNLLWIPCISIIFTELIILYLTLVPSVTMYTYVSLAIIPSLFGGGGAFRSLVSLYVSCTTNEKHRTSRFITVEAVTVAALFLSGILSGHLIETFGFVAPQIILLFVMFSVIPLSCCLDRAITKDKSQNVLLGNFSRALAVTIRKCTPAAVCIIFSQIALGFGEISCQKITFLYSMNSKFNFTSTTGGYLLGFYSVTRGIGSVAILPLLLNYFKVCEWKLCAVVAPLQIGFYLMNAFAGNRNHLFIAPIFLTLQDLYRGVYMSSLSKIYSGQPRTLIFAFQITASMVAVNVGTIIINYTYKATFDLFPGLVYIVFGSISVVATVIGTIGVYLARNRHIGIDIDTDTDIDIMIPHKSIEEVVVNEDI